MEGNDTQVIKGIAHLAFLVKDLDESLDFYVNKLGFKKKFTLNNDNGSTWIIYIEIGHNQFIELFPAFGEVEKRRDNDSYAHLCLEVTDIEKVVFDLKEKGVDIDQPVIMGLDNNYQAWIHDPDGNAIELMEYGKDSLQLQK